MIDIFFQLIYYVVNLFKWAVILSAVFSILASFGVLDTRNRLVWTIGDFLYRVTDPVLRPIRNMLPNFGGIDISPWVVVVLIQSSSCRCYSKSTPRSPTEPGNRWSFDDVLAPACGRGRRRGEGTAEVASARIAGHPTADGERLRIGVTEAAEGGRANRAACAALADALGWRSRRCVDVGVTSREKTLRRRGRPRRARRKAGSVVSARIIDGKAIAAALRARWPSRSPRCRFARVWSWCW